MGQFSLDLSRAVAKAKGNTSLAVKRVMLETFTRCIAKSPVDTGRFRANWTASIGSYSTGTTDALDKRRVGDRKGPTIDAMAYMVDGVQLGDYKVFLVNNLPYSHVLEYGRASGKPGSLQAPQGIVRITLAEVVAKYGK